jgi:hypothetical protein
MYHRVEQFFYVSAGIFLMMILFLLQSSPVVQTSEVQNEFKSEVKLVLNDLTQGLDPLREVKLVYGGITDFYGSAAGETIALLEPIPAPPQMQRMIDHVALATAQVFDFSKPANNLHIADTQSPFAISRYSDPAPAFANIVPPFEEVFYEFESFDEELGMIADEHSQIAAERGRVAGKSVVIDQPANSATTPWVTLKDNVTGQQYCVSIYNNEVNRYSGPCKYDYY